MTTALIDATLEATLQALAQGEMSHAVTITRPATVSAGKAGANTSVATSQPLAVWGPGAGSQVQLLQELGGGRASRFGGMTVGTDVQPGDTLTESGVIWKVHGVDDTGVDQMLLALSFLIDPTAIAATGTEGQPIGLLLTLTYAA